MKCCACVGSRLVVISSLNFARCILSVGCSAAPSMQSVCIYKILCCCRVCYNPKVCFSNAPCRILVVGCDFFPESGERRALGEVSGEGLEEADHARVEDLKAET